MRVVSTRPVKSRDQKEIELLLRQTRKNPDNRPDVMTIVNGDKTTRVVIADGADWIYKMLKTKEALLAEYYSTTACLVVRGLVDADLTAIIDAATALGGEITKLERVTI